MKAIINGKRYDTATAKQVAVYSNNLGMNDFRNLEEAIYITEKGNWFLAGYGGALTEYAEAAGDMKCSGERITRLSPEEAMDWLEQHNETEALEKYFTEELEDA